MKQILVAAAVLGLGISSAMALPVAPLQTSGSTSVIQVDDHGWDNHHRPMKKRPHYNPGGHYAHAPQGWHQYRSRPGDWHNRGCILVGPFWFCP